MNDTDDIWNQELFAAIEREDKATVQAMLLERLRRISPGFEDGYPTLYAAIVLERPDIVEALIARGEDIHQRYYGRSPLFYALLHGAACVTVLLKAGADPNLPDEEGENNPVQETIALRWMTNDVEGSMRALMEGGADPNVRLEDGNPALVIAALFYREDAIALIEYGADVNMAAENGATALLAASSNGDEPLVRLLLEHEADPNPVCSNGNCPLNVASQLEHREIEQLLLDAGASPSRESIGNMWNLVDVSPYVILFG